MNESVNYYRCVTSLHRSPAEACTLTPFLVSPQIMLLTDPEVESSLLISLDEGASYQKHSLAFDILSLLFHPEQEDWILAYSHDQKVMCNCQDEMAEITTKNVTGKKKKMSGWK